MPRPRADEKSAQLSLFANAPEGDPVARPARTERRTREAEPVETFATDEDRELGAAVPPHVLLGTSSWTFPGWGGLVYAGRPSEKALVAGGLAAYARHPLFRTVGIDRSYYAPLGTRELAEYAAALPAGFRCVQKAWSGITQAHDPRTGERVATYLDPSVCVDRVIGPIAEAFAEHAGPLVLEFAPMRSTDRPGVVEFARALDAFFSKLPRTVPLAVELRNRELLAPPYLDVLRAHGVGHVLNLWERMPDVGEQLAIPGVLTAPFVVARLLIRPGRRYADQKAQFAPFDRVVEVDAKMRDDVVALADACAALGKVLFVVVNNKVEGSSPLSVRAIAGKLVRRVDDVPL